MGNLAARHSLRTAHAGEKSGFTIVAVLTLALGIGANAAIFSLTDQVLLRLLPVESPRELVVLTSPGVNHGRVWSDIEGGPSFSYPMYKDLRDRNEVFAGPLASFHVQVNVAGQGSRNWPTACLLAGIISKFWACGRFWASAHRARRNRAGRESGDVLSYGYWARHFGSDPNILNKQLA